MNGILGSLPPPPVGKFGWPWTEETNPSVFDKIELYPKVSIVMPSYNQGLFIEESIRSLLLQNYPNLEFIVMDGGSSDDSVSIIKKYEPWITFWRSGKDGGQSHAINMGLERSTGEWFNWLNSDDYYLPEAFFNLSKAIIDDIQKPVAVCGKPLVQPMKGGIRSLPENNRDKFYEDFIALGYYQVAALYDINKVKMFGGVDENLHFGMDLKLVMQMNFAGIAKRVNKHVIVMRSHAASKGVKHASQFYKDWLVAYSSSLSYFPEEIIDKTLFNKIREITGVDFSYVPSYFKPDRFTREEYRHAQIYIGERIINLMYIYNQRGVSKMVKFYKENYSEYYKKTNLWFVHFKSLWLVRIAIRIKKLIINSRTD